MTEGREKTFPSPAQDSQTQRWGTAWPPVMPQFPFLPRQIGLGEEVLVRGHLSPLQRFILSLPLGPGLGPGLLG